VNSMAASTKPWVEKYRPHSLAEVVAHEEVVLTLEKSMKGGDMPHMLFHGPPGVGKTTVALAFCKQLFKNQWRERVLEMNASDERGIDVVRERIKHFCEVAVKNGSTVGGPPRIKVVILDEADQMTEDAQGALRRMMETCSATTRFMILCNYVAKLISPIQSRCMKYHFDPLPAPLLNAHLRKIIDQENLTIKDAALQKMIEAGHGDMRLSLSWLQMLAQMQKQGLIITETTIDEVLGLLPENVAQMLWNVIEKGDEELMKATVEDLLVQGFDVKMMLREVGKRILQCPGLTALKKAETLGSLALMESNIVNKCDDSIQAKSVFWKCRKIVQEQAPFLTIPGLPDHLFPRVAMQA